LQNRSIKILAKALKRRLQKEIRKLIDLNQSGFLKGWSISEIFVFLRLNWYKPARRETANFGSETRLCKGLRHSKFGLDLVLQARSFSVKWRNWIQSIPSSSRSAVLVNGCLGPWISCKRGPRHGDPLSPYLFLIVAIQDLIKKYAQDIKHPIDSSAHCVMLQYADDTPIVIKGELHGVQKLKEVLDLFCGSNWTDYQLQQKHSSVHPSG
jgi:hypothetical protein